MYHLQSEIQWDGGDLALRYPWRTVTRNQRRKERFQERLDAARRYANTPEANHLPTLVFTGTGVEVRGWYDERNDRGRRNDRRRRR